VFIDDDGQAYLYFGGNSQIGSGANVQDRRTRSRRAS
jgi:arabinoxylan arabinofuranohydrolase